MNHGEEHSAARRHEVTVLVGPCEKDEVEELMLAIADLPECKNIGGCVAAHLWKDNDGEA